MSTFTLNGAPLELGAALLPGYGVWWARVKLAPPAPTAGAAGVLVLGDLTLMGTVRSSGEFASSAAAFLVGGADGWTKTVKRRPYRADNGVRIAQVAADLAGEVGEQLVLEPGADRSIGYAFPRPAGPASDVLDAMGVLWWVAADGVTHLGTRPAVPAPAQLRAAVESWDPLRRRAVLGLPDDAFAGVAPGRMLALEGVPAITVATTRITVSKRGAVVEVLAR